MAAAGLWYNSEYLAVDYSDTLEKLSADDPEIKGDDLSEFYMVFYVLSGIWQAQDLWSTHAVRVLGC
jgi:hypothetical protein